MLFLHSTCLRELGYQVGCCDACEEVSPPPHVCAGQELSSSVIRQVLAVYLAFLRQGLSLIWVSLTSLV